VARYRTDIELYIKPNLGGVRLDQLKAPAFDALYAKLLRENGLSPSSVKHVHSTLSSALTQAFDYEVIPMPIMKKVKGSDEYPGELLWEESMTPMGLSRYR